MNLPRKQVYPSLQYHIRHSKNKFIQHLKRAMPHKRTTSLLTDIRRHNTNATHSLKRRSILDKIREFSEKSEYADHIV